LIEALKAVVHLPLNVNEDEGVALAKEYAVGTTYPVFVLTDSAGTEINRWIGYTGGSTVLIRTLNWALQDLTPIVNREARCKSNPSQKEALFLAGYFSKSGKYDKSVGYYRRAIGLGGGKGYDYAYEIFSNAANAVWNEMFPFDSVYPAADAVLTSKMNRKDNIVKVAQLMTRLSRKFDHYNGLEKYYQAAIDISTGDKATQQLLKADYALCISNDTATATAIKKNTMGPGWENERDKFYEYAQWCLERRIHLDEAEMYARKAINLVYPGMYRARVLGTVAEICEARGDLDGAIEAAQLAINEEPDNLLYQNLLKRFQEAAGH
jgi:tetratricopeptide (TPR) repeat protein